MNPVGKVRQFVDHITSDIIIANKLMSVICHELSAEEIDTLWKEHHLHLNALNDEEQISLF